MDRTLRLALELLATSEAAVTRTRGTDPPSLWVVMGLLTKACKTYRAMQLLCEVGLIEDANSAARTLLELLIAVRWILKKDTRKRTQMFVAYRSVCDDRMFRAWKGTTGLKRHATKRLLKEVADQLAASEAILGAKQLGKLVAGYSGMTIRKTAREVGLAVAYELYYRYASTFAHGSDLASHADAPDDGGQGVVLNLSLGPSEGGCPGGC